MQAGVHELLTHCFTIALLCVVDGASMHGWHIAVALTYTHCCFHNTLKLNNCTTTGYLSLNRNPLTAVTIGALEDLGYQVNYGQADAMSLVSFRTAKVRAAGSPVEYVEENQYHGIESTVKHAIVEVYIAAR
jgi:hypothetical protein